MKKSVRQAHIEQIINQYSVSTQDELMDRLNEAGIHATQATISRDIHEMQIVKQPDGNGDLHYTIYKVGNQSEMKRLKETISESVTKIEQIQIINVIHTLPSYANLLAAIIDNLNLDTIAGTLAGHDTIVMISHNEVEAKKIYMLFFKEINPNLLEK